MILCVYVADGNRSHIISRNPISFETCRPHAGVAGYDQAGLGMQVQDQCDEEQDVHWILTMQLSNSSLFITFTVKSLKTNWAGP